MGIPNDSPRTRPLLKFLDELMLAGRFCFVGLLSTTVHILVVWILLRAREFPPLAANTIAFLLAFGVSFVGHYFWTFRSPGKPSQAALRFFLISACAFAVNTIFLESLLYLNLFAAAVSAVLSAAVVPIITYSASRLWGFLNSKKN